MEFDIYLKLGSEAFETLRCIGRIQKEQQRLTPSQRIEVWNEIIKGYCEECGREIQPEQTKVKTDQKIMGNLYCPECGRKELKSYCPCWSENK